ncbi:MAG: hypothetical protein ABF629_09430 [Sporolactobacillus sp.]|uniref:hypothetical protein n=1 Tax=Sporolactobacillus sp. STSJ-5 TaxID=2965076 RepID=UPI00210512BC|nr:hypothetical protein [Sporolactobacillus sp. STSJ-5]MCQ2010132.1 hypothetical protein [Sporolactobacillus sp. STSJ-5]
MQVPQVRTVITTGQSMKNTFNQLSALEQEKRALQYHADQIHFQSNSSGTKDNLTKIETSITGLDRQIQQVRNEQMTSSSDQITISREAYQLYKQIV